jgi:hypothetical protein
LCWAFLLEPNKHMDDTSAAPAATEQNPSAAPAATAQVSETTSGQPLPPELDTGNTPEAVTTGEADAGVDAPKSSNKVPYRERIEQLVQARRAAELERDHALNRIREIEQAQQQGHGQQQLDPMAYASDAEYQVAMQRELAKNVSEAVRREMLSDQQRTAETRATQARDMAWGERIQAFRERAPDFEQVALNQGLPLSEAMAEMIKESDFGPEIAYWLGKNPQDSARIAALPPTRAAVEIGRLEARFMQPAAPRFTQAPAPVKTVSSGNAAATKSPQDMTFAEYEAMRMAQMQSKA